MKTKKSAIKTSIIICTLLAFSLNFNEANAFDYDCEEIQQMCYNQNPFIWWISSSEYNAYEGGCDNSYESCLIVMGEDGEQEPGEG